MKLNRHPRNRFPAMGLLALAAGLSIAAPAFAQDPAAVTQEAIISGTMDIEFPTRTKLDAKGNPTKGAKDIYRFALNVARTTEFQGTIARVPRILEEGGIFKGDRETQGNQLEFDINLHVIHPTDPTQRKTVGKWVGVVPINDQGAYELEGTTRSPHRIRVDAAGTASGFEDLFGGRLVGKPKEEKKSGQAVTFVRKVAGKDVKIEVKNSDPMRFDNVVLAKGPAGIYPRTIVNGNLDYDYETGNWYTNGIKFRYNLNGKDVEDIVTGSIKWVEDPNRATNGKGRYEFNLRFNEGQNTPASTEADAFAGMSDEEAFFAVDTSIPSMSGTIEYVDVMASGGETVASSKVTYKLDANKLTKQQVLNLFKLWMLGVGPINDE